MNFLAAIASFEKWYANQIKYHKVTGEEPGKELKSWSYSVKEVADLLGVDEYLVYDLLKKNQIEAVIVDYWKRIPKESFQNWYKSQSRYRTKEDREKDALLEDATITMPEMAQLLGTTRSSVYTILDNPKYSHFFEFIVIAEKKRITKESFQKFLGDWNLANSELNAWMNGTTIEGGRFIITVLISFILIALMIVVGQKGADQ